MTFFVVVGFYSDTLYSVSSKTSCDVQMIESIYKSCPIAKIFTESVAADKHQTRP